MEYKLCHPGVAHIERTGLMNAWKSKLLFGFIVTVLCLSGVPVSANPALELVRVSADLREMRGHVAAKVEVVNVSNEALGVEISDAYGNGFVFTAVQPDDSVIVTMQTGTNVVMGYTVQIVARAAGGQISARGYSLGTLDLRLMSPLVVTTRQPNHCDVYKVDWTECFRLLGIPVA